LYAVFTAPPVMRVQHGREDVGYIQALFVSMHDRNKGPLCFRLSGRAWEVGHIEWSKGVLHVRPAEHGRVPSWLGLPGVLSTKLCQAMMDVLMHENVQQEAGWLTRSAAVELASMRESYGGLLEAGTAPLEEQPEGVKWHTFAGGRSEPAPRRWTGASVGQEVGGRQSLG
jgi:ATP-dependent Lhr-like helicase